MVEGSGMEQLDGGAELKGDPYSLSYGYHLIDLCFLAWMNSYCGLLINQNGSLTTHNIHTITVCVCVCVSVCVCV